VSRRSYANDRYRKGTEHSTTRKSAAKAKPVRSRGTVATPVKAKPKSGPMKDWAGLPTSPEIKKWRRIWWVLLLGSVALILAGWFIEQMQAYQSIIAVIALVASAVALAIELLVIRRLRNALLAPLRAKKGGSDKGADKGGPHADAAKKGRS
jgi:hypothetical protein